MDMYDDVPEKNMKRVILIGDRVECFQFITNVFSTFMSSERFFI